MEIQLAYVSSGRGLSFSFRNDIYFIDMGNQLNTTWTKKSESSKSLNEHYSNIEIKSVNKDVILFKPKYVLSASPTL